MSKGGRRCRQGSADIPARLAGSGEDRAQGSARLGTGLGAETAGDFLPDFPHAQLPFRLIVRERHGGIAQEPRANALKVLTQQHFEQVVGVQGTGEALAGHAFGAGLLA